MKVLTDAEIIRPLQSGDFDRIAEIYDLSHAQEYSGEVYQFPPQPLVDNSALLDLFHASEIFVFEDEGEIKGFVGHQGSHIAWLYVDPEFQGCGVGKQLIEFLLNRLNGIAVISVVKTNHAALHLYQQRGFRINGEYDFDYQGQPVTALVLVRGF